MVKWGLSVVMVLGFVMSIAGFYEYSSSGTEVARFDLKPGKLNQGQIQVSPDMSSMRAVLGTRFISGSSNLHVTHYEYTFTVRDTVGAILVDEPGSHSESRKETPSHHQRTAVRSNNHILDSWPVEYEGIYQWQVALNNRQARVQAATLTVRKNVMTEFPKSVTLGGILMVVSLILLIMLGKANKVRG